MKTNKTIVLLGLALVLLLVIKVSQRSLSQPPNEAVGYISHWQGLTAGDVTKLTVANGTATISLEKKGDHQWTAQGYPVDSTALETWLPKLINSTNAAVVSDNATAHPDMEISSTSATLTVTSPKEDKVLRLGVSGTNGRFVAFTDSPVVYAIDGLPATVNSTAISDWVDKIISRLDSKTITGITMTQGKVVTSLKSDGTKWTNDQGKELDTANIVPLTMTLESFATQGLISAEESVTLPKKPAFTVSVSQQNQSEPVVFTFYQLPESGAVSVTGRPGVYKVSSSILSSFNLKPGDLKTK